MYVYIYIGGLTRIYIYSQQYPLEPFLFISAILYSLARRFWSSSS